MGRAKPANDQEIGVMSQWAATENSPHAPVADSPAKPNPANLQLNLPVAQSHAEPRTGLLLKVPGLTMAAARVTRSLNQHLGESYGNSGKIGGYGIA